MKVALINPAAKGVKYSVEPMGLGYIAGYLEQNGIEVKIIDQMAGDDVSKEITIYHPDIAGITSMTPMVMDAYGIADMCRRMKILTIMGGPHPSAMPEEALGHADVVVVGEGELAMLDIIKKGISSGIISRPYLEDIDEIPLPSRRLMKQRFDLHTGNKLKMSMLAFLGSALPLVKSASVLTSRGCPFRCIFCPNSLRQPPVRFHSAARVLEDIRRLKADYGVEVITFLDDNFLVNKPRLEEICRKMIEEKLKITWCCGASAHFIDRKTVEMIREAGCRLVAFGVESGSQRILNVLGKSTTVEQNKEAMKICKEAGLLVHASFMLGNPTETIEDVRLTQKFIRQTQPDVFYVNITTPYPGTKLWESYQERIPRPINWRGFKPSDSLDVYPCTTFSRVELGRLFFETMLVKPVVYSRDWKTALRHPVESVNWLLRHPLTAAKIIAGRYVVGENRKRGDKRSGDGMKTGRRISPPGG